MATPEEEKAAAEAAQKQAAEEARLKAEAEAREKQQEASDPDYWKKKAIYYQTEIRTIHTDRDEAKKRLKELEDAERARKQSEMTDLQKAQAEVERLKTEAAGYKQRAEQYDALDKAQRAAIKERLGADYDPSFDALPLATLQSIAEKIKKTTAQPPPPGGDQGTLPKDYAEALDDSKKMEALLKNPELHQKLLSEYQNKNRR